MIRLSLFLIVLLLLIVGLTLVLLYQFGIVVAAVTIMLAVAFYGYESIDFLALAGVIPRQEWTHQRAVAFGNLFRVTDILVPQIRQARPTSPVEPTLTAASAKPFPVIQQRPAQRSFADLLQDLERSFQNGGAYDTWCATPDDQDVPSKEFMVALGLEKALYCLSKCHANSVGNANLWIAHDVKSRRPQYVTSSMREGFFAWDQIVNINANSVEYRPVKIDYFNSNTAVVAECVKAGKPLVRDLSAGESFNTAELALGIGVVLGLPLRDWQSGTEIQEGSIVAVTVDLYPPMTPDDREQVISRAIQVRDFMLCVLRWAEEH